MLYGADRCVFLFSKRRRYKMLALVAWAKRCIRDTCVVKGKFCRVDGFNGVIIERDRMMGGEAGGEVKARFC